MALIQRATIVVYAETRAPVTIKVYAEPLIPYADVIKRETDGFGNSSMAFKNALGKDRTIGFSAQLQAFVDIEEV